MSEQVIHRPRTMPDAVRGAPRGLVACMCACTLLVVGLVAAINLAVPMLASSDLRPGSSALLWVVDAYVVVFACLVIPGGAAGDRFGRKGTLLVGLGLLAVGAAGSALAPTTALLLTGRVLTGAGATLVLPNCVGVLVHATSGAERRRAVATWGAVSGMGGVVGNTVGAGLLATGSWRVLFAAVVPVAAGAMVWVARTVPVSPRSDRRLDPVGTALLVAATVALLGGIVEGPERGWGSPLVLGAFAAAAVLALAWTVVELRTRHPLLDPRLFRLPGVTAAGLGLFVTFFGSFGLFYVNASLLQYGRGFSVVQAGLGIMPLAIPLLVLVRFVPRLVARVGVLVPMCIAFPAIGIGLLGLASAVHQSYAAYAGWLVLVGLGFALALPSLSAELTASMPPEQAGAAGGLQSAVRELGSALGVAVVGTVLTSAFVGRLPSDLAQAHPVPRTVAQALKAAPERHALITDRFADAAQVGLVVAAVVTLVAGLVVIAVSAAGRRAGPAGRPARRGRSRGRPAAAR